MQTIQNDRSQTHNHDGINSSRIAFANLIGFIRTVSVVPTNTPADTNNQIVLYANSTTYRLYIYDKVNLAWRYVALT